MTDILLLDKRITDSGLKRTYIAKRLNITRASLYRKLKGLSDFSVREVSDLCDILGICDVYEKEQIFFAKKVD